MVVQNIPLNIPVKRQNLRVPLPDFTVSPQPGGVLFGAFLQQKNIFRQRVIMQQGAGNQVRKFSLIHAQMPSHCGAYYRDTFSVVGTCPQIGNFHHIQRLGQYPDKRVHSYCHGMSILQMASLGKAKPSILTFLAAC